MKTERKRAINSSIDSFNNKYHKMSKGKAKITLQFREVAPLANINFFE
jgi:hypothetical protein